MNERSAAAYELEPQTSTAHGLGGSLG
jgi:hypothetical protein